ncbi:nucleoside-diphosphate-sugar epimerase [Spinactinospora alkalitolerans]|uniref:Nucleoside-diphosphate-sugar epimerase n=1 Tax=Spinactinospora alkalitolerans TaxID=687207 RepID=A0A852U7U1_9ACTN|nr:NAD(P)-dependent oxidoreductase [Spinactinospora alkalitolerans]NYE50134.1 nucleoside-diphosphate-sugar epimerase [Spinactinospora alkalitolerans]
MHVLVTGGSGRLGRSVLRGLAERGHEVTGVDTAPARGGEGFPFFPADLTDAGECYSVIAHFRPDAVVHLAAVPAPFQRSDISTFETNARLAFNLCQAASDLGVGTVLVASSPTVAGYGNPGGWRPSYLPLDEDHPIAPWNSYSMSKAVAEQIVRGFAARGRGRFHAFRPCFVVSQEEWKGAPIQGGGTIRERLERPELAAVSLFNYVDARDAADFAALLLEQADTVPNGQTFFVGADDALAEGPLSDLLPRHAGVPQECAADLAEGVAAFSSRKARELLGWRPRHTWRTEID